MADELPTVGGKATSIVTIVVVRAHRGAPPGVWRRRERGAQGLVGEEAAALVVARALAAVRGARVPTHVGTLTDPPVVVHRAALRVAVRVGATGDPPVTLAVADPTDDVVGGAAAVVQESARGADLRTIGINDLLELALRKIVARATLEIGILAGDSFGAGTHGAAYVRRQADAIDICVVHGALGWAIDN
jgi:hypothetical protein